MIDLRMEKCPITYVKARIHMDNLLNGDVAEILVSSYDVAENMQNGFAKIGYVIKNIVEIENYYKLIIQK